MLLKLGLTDLNQVCSEHQIKQLLRYVTLLDRWNSAFNLTAITDPKEMLVKHLFDSLAVGPYLSGQKFIDVGTGAGLPGVPLAITNTHRNFDLLDSNGKKTRFLFQVRTRLGLNNISEIQQRVAEHWTDIGYDGIISRAFASLSDMVKNTSHLLSPGGKYYAMKGRVMVTEIQALPVDVEVESILKLTVPGLNEERHLIVIGKK